MLVIFLVSSSPYCRLGCSVACLHTPELRHSVLVCESVGWHCLRCAASALPVLLNGPWSGGWQPVCLMNTTADSTHCQALRSVCCLQTVASSGTLVVSPTVVVRASPRPPAYCRCQASTSQRSTKCLLRRADVLPRPPGSCMLAAELNAVLKYSHQLASRTRRGATTPADWSSARCHP